MKLGLGIRLNGAIAAQNFGSWVIDGTDIDAAPSSRAPSNLLIEQGVVYGPAGYYSITNVTDDVTQEVYESPPFALTKYGQAGDEFEIRHITYSTDSPAITIPAGGTILTETWSGYSVGNTFTQLDTLYTRQSTDIATDVVSDTDGPSGKRITVTINTTNTRWLYRDDTVYTDGTWSRFQIRGRIKVPTGTNSVVGIGFGPSSSFTGVALSRSGTNPSGRLAYLSQQDIAGTLLNTTIGTQIVSGLADAQSRDVLIDVGTDKRTVRIRQWLTGSSEPTDWQAEYTLAADATLSSGMRLVGRVATSGNTNRQLGWKLGIDTDAPAF